MRNSRLNFVRQQGFWSASPMTCDYQFPALMWQPRALSALMLVGLWTQSSGYFIALGLVLAWNVLVPRLNPFDLAYNAVISWPMRRPAAGPAPAPRRFAQGLASILMFATALLIQRNQFALALAAEAIMFAALGGLVFGRFCAGSFLYLVITGKWSLARRTLPGAWPVPATQLVRRRRDTQPGRQFPQKARRSAA